MAALTVQVECGKQELQKKMISIRNIVVNQGDKLYSKLSQVANIDPITTSPTNIIEIKYEQLHDKKIINQGKGKEVCWL